MLHEEETESGLAFFQDGSDNPRQHLPLAFEAPFSWPHLSYSSFLGLYASSNPAAQAPG